MKYICDVTIFSLDRGHICEAFIINLSILVVRYLESGEARVIHNESLRPCQSLQKYLLKINIFRPSSK